MAQPAVSVGANSGCVAMSNDDVAWYENPAWERHLISPTIQGLNVCMAVADIDGDGLPEIAAGADWQFGNTTSGGALYVLREAEVWGARAPPGCFASRLRRILPPSTSESEVVSAAIWREFAANRG